MDEWQQLESTLDPDRPFGARWWGWNVAPMEVASSCYQTQSFSWVLRRKYRRQGLQGLSYFDVYNLFCKPRKAQGIAAFIKEDFKRHGLMRSTRTPEGEQTKGIILTSGVDLEARPMMFFVPKEKTTGIAAQANAIINESTMTHRCLPSRRLQICAWRLASIAGKLMATSIITGNTPRLMTRACYSQIARETGVPADTPKRELKIACDKFITVDKATLDALRFWVRWLPKHKGTPIHPKEIQVMIFPGHDVSETAWGGFFDDGSSIRTLSRGELRAEEDLQSSALRERKAAGRNVQTFANKG